MEKHYDLNDSEFKEQFINCELNPSDFTHEAHLRLAWIFIGEYGPQIAENKLQTSLRKFVEHAGANDKYNTTVTVAAAKAVSHFKSKSNSDNFRDFIIEFPRLKANFKDLLAQHYGFDIYNSKKAKVEFLKPDLLPFD